MKKNTDSQIVANILPNMMPENPYDIISQAIKYLYLQRPKLPHPDVHAILTSSQEWYKCGHILGNAISRLSFPNNSVIFLLESKDVDNILVPPINSSIILPHSSILTDQILVDNNVINKINKNINCSNINSVSILEKNSLLFIGMPLVIEAARIRKRGFPLCTPILFGKNCNRANLILILQKIIEKDGIGLVILNNNFIHEKDDEFIKNIGLSFLPELFPLFFNDNYNGITLLTYLAHIFKTSINIISEGKYIDNDKIFEDFSLGISKNKTYDILNINDINIREKIWKNVLNSIKNTKHIDLNLNGSALVKIRNKKNKILYNKLSFDNSQDLGKAIWNASKDIFNDFDEEDLDNCFLDVTCIKNPESLCNIKKINQENVNKYNIIINDNNQPQNISIKENITKTIQDFDIDKSKSYLYQPFTISLPLNIILLLHDMDY